MRTYVDDTVDVTASDDLPQLPGEGGRNGVAGDVESGASQWLAQSTLDSVTEHLTAGAARGQCQERRGNLVQSYRPAVTRFDLPTIEPETQPFWDAAREHRLLIQHCRACDRWQHYPRPFCSSCWSEQVEWAEASGEATLYTFSIVRRNDLPPFDQRVPYVAAVVDLAEGPRMITEVVDCDLDAVEIGMPWRSPTAT